MPKQKILVALFVSVICFLPLHFTRALTMQELMAYQTGNMGKVLGDNACSYPYASASLINDNGTIYFVRDNVKIPFSNFQAFHDFGYLTANVINGNLQNYTLSSYIISTANTAHPWGSWLLFNGTVYYATQSGLVGVPSMDIFTQNGGQQNYIIKANRFDTAALFSQPKAQALTNNDSRVYGSQNKCSNPGGLNFGTGQNQNTLIPDSTGQTSAGNATSTQQVNHAPPSPIAGVLEYSNMKSVVYFTPHYESDTSLFLAADLQKIKTAGFNTVFLPAGWNNFESNINPPTYVDSGFAELKKELDLLKANNMKALIALNPNVPPSGVDIYNWISIPSQYQAYQNYVAYLLNQILPYKDMVYVYVLTENSVPYDVIMKDPAGSAAKLRATLGNLPNALSQDLRKNFKIGYHDNEFIPLNLISSTANSPIASPNPFDFVSMTAYPVLFGFSFPNSLGTNLTASQISSTLDQRVGYFKTLYPSTPFIIAEMGYPSCSAQGDEAEQNLVGSSMVNYALSKGYGFNYWSWGADMLSLSDPCNEISYGLLRPDNTAKPLLGSLQSLLNSGSQGAPQTAIPASLAPAADNATFVSASVPAAMTAGQQYQISYTFLNSGTTTWKKGDFSSNALYRLASQTFGSDSTWGVTRGDFNTNEIVAPGQQKTFTITVTAPSASGTYYLMWRMLVEGYIWFGQTTPVAAINVGSTGITATVPLNAQIVSQNVPTAVASGQYLDASVVVKNTGSTTWTNSSSSYAFQLGSQNPASNNIWGGNALTLGQDIAPGQTTTFTFHVPAPSQAGAYNFQWQMLQNTSSGPQYFGSSTPNVQVVVSAPKTLDAQIVSQNVPTSVVVGQYLDATITVKNTGSTTWTDSGSNYQFQLGSQNPAKNNIWEGSALTLTQNIPIGQQTTFVFHVKAPSTAGTYNFQWQMLQNGFGGAQYFGDQSPNVQVQVR